MTHSLELNVSKGTDTKQMGKGLELEGSKLSVEEGVAETVSPTSQFYLG